MAFRSKFKQLTQNQKLFCVCHYVYKAFTYKFFVFPNMVVSKMNIQMLCAHVTRFNPYGFLLLFKLLRLLLLCKNQTSEFISSFFLSPKIDMKF